MVIKSQQFFNLLNWFHDPPDPHKVPVHAEIPTKHDLIQAVATQYSVTIVIQLYILQYPLANI